MKSYAGVPLRRERFFHLVYELVREIPRGRVASYGRLAQLLGKRGGARGVGWALRALPENSGVPWQRVVNARGELSLGGRSGDLQRALLESEGIQFDETGRIAMEKFAWNPQQAGDDKPPERDA